MLELTLEQISMGQTAVDKSAALQLIADHLVADGLVADGYLTGLQNREKQGSTFLGQGIAIPHGTPETRDQVFTTGVRLVQFPDGVDWGDGQMVYLAIGIAAKSDEHLRLLQLLTRALGEDDIGQALRTADSPEALLKLLQGAPQELALDSQLISLGVSADDFEELVWRGARLLRKADCVSNGFAAVLQQVEALSLGDGLWWLHSEQTVKRPGLAFVTPDKPIRYLGQPLTGLFCLASLGEAHQNLLERLCAALGIPYALRPIAQAEVFDADELLLSSASKEVLPVVTLDGRTIGNGRPGPIYQQLYDAYQAAKQRNADPTHGAPT